jgi:hypothetical protein
MMNGASGRLAALLFVVMALFLGLTSAPAWAGPEAACVGGHNSVAPPCTFDGGVLSLDAGSVFDVGSGVGHAFTITFTGTTIDVACGVDCPFAASDAAGGSNAATLSLTVSAVDGTALIDDVSLALTDPTATGTGSIAWSLGTLSGDQNTTAGDLTFGTPQSSITETLDITLDAGCGAEPCDGGNASIQGFTLNISLVPEPGTALLLAGALLGLLTTAGGMRRRI